MPLPEFTLQTRVTAVDAKHDNIQYTLPLGTLRDVPPNPNDDDWQGIDIDEVANALVHPQ